MIDIVKESLVRNGNGSGAINARGIPHRGWTDEERIAAAADAVLGAVHVVPSIGQAATAFFVPRRKLAAELKARAKAQAQVEPTNGAAVEEITVSVTPVVSDTPALRVSLRRLAAVYGCEIVQFDGDWDSRIDRGPYLLRDVASGTNIWDGGLPVEGIADALMCLMRERQLPEDRMYEAWANFGSSWLP
jgi:hypothetical protein